MLGKINPFHLNIQITLMLLTSKWMGLDNGFDEKPFFKMLWWLFSSKLDWGFYINSVVKTASKKTEVLIRQSSFLLRLCFIFYKWDKVFKNGPNKICRRQSLKSLKFKLETSNFLKAVFHKFYLVHSWILCLKYSIRLCME